MIQVEVKELCRPQFYYNTRALVAFDLSIYDGQSLTKIKKIRKKAAGIPAALFASECFFSFIVVFEDRSPQGLCQKVAMRSVRER